MQHGAASCCLVPAGDAGRRVTNVGGAAGRRELVEHLLLGNALADFVTNLLS
jgi:hypothetical protein